MKTPAPDQRAEGQRAGDRPVSAANAEATVGRWRTLKDAADLLHMSQNALLKSLKRGQIRGTQIGNNWFAYVDAEMVDEAAEKARRRDQKREMRKQTVTKLKAENQALRADLKQLTEKAALPAKADGTKTVPDSTSEVAYLRAELRAMREQHAEEMRRKDILLRQSHQLLQDVVQSGVLQQHGDGGAKRELDRLRREHRQSAKMMAEMSDVLHLMYRRLQRAEANDV